MGMIRRIKSNLKAPLIALGLLISLILLPLTAHSGAWDQLSEAEQKIVRERLVDELGKMLNEGKLNENLQFTAKHIGTWATHAGEIVEGNFDNAINATMKYSTDQFLASFEKELGTKIDSLENSALSFVYKQVISHKGESKKIARLALNGDFSTAGNIAWETAKKDVQQQIQTKTEETLKFAFNWAFDGAKIGSYTPVDIFLEIIRIEKIIIPELKNYLTNTQLRQILQIYKDELAQSGGNHNAAWIMIRDSHIPIKAHSVSSLNEETLRQALEQCAGSYSSLGQCIGDVQSSFNRKLAQEKQRSENLLRNIAEESKEKSREGYKEVQKLIQRIIAEHSKDYKDAISEANSILKKLQTQARGIKGDCDAFDAKKEVVDQAQEKVKQANIAAAKIKNFLNTADQCKLLSEAPKDLDTLLQQLKTVNSTFEGHMQSVTDQANKVCQVTGNIGAAFSKSEGKKLLDQAINEQKKLNQAVSETDSSAALVRRTAQEIKTAATSFKTELSSMDKDIGSSNYLDEEQQKLNAAKNAKKGYDAAVAAMKKIAERLKARQKNMDEANPVELSVMEQVDKAMAGGINKEEKVRTAKLLKKYKDFPKVKEILAKIKETNSQAECAYRVARQMGSPDQDYKWKDPNFSDDLLAKFKEAKSDCQSMPGADAFDKYEQQATSIAAEMEAKELPWIPQKQAERCIADGLVAYQSLVDPATALSGSVEQLEKTCGNAKTIADRASHTANAAVQAGESLTNALVKQSSGLNIDDTLGACARLDEIKAGVLQSAASAKAAAASAQSAAAKGSATAQSCVSKSSLGSIDGDLAAIKKHQYDAVIAYGKAQEGDDLFDRIVGAANKETARIQKTKEGFSQLLIYRAAIKDHIKNSNSDKEAALAGFKNCKAQQADLSSKAAAMGGNPDDKVLPGLIQRINSVTTEPGPELASIDGQLENARASLKLLESAGTEIDTAIARVKTECLGKTTPYAEVLGASQSILTIEDLKTQLIQKRNQCLASLDAKSTDASASAGSEDDDRGGYDFDEDEGNVDPERVAAGGGASGSVGSGGLPGANPEQQNTSRTGTGIDPSYGRDPIAEARRERERAADAARVAEAGNPFGEGYGDQGGGMDEFQQPPDLDRIPNPDEDSDRDREQGNSEPPAGSKPPEQTPPTQQEPGKMRWYVYCVQGKAVVRGFMSNNSNFGANSYESEAAAKTAAAKMKCDGTTKPETKPETKPDPKGDKGGAPAKPPTVIPPPVKPPAENAVCKQLVKKMQSMASDYTKLTNNYMAAARAKDEDALKLYGCKILTEADRFYDLFSQYTSAKCPVGGDVGRLRDAFSQGRTAVQQSLNQNCGGSSGASQPAQFAGRWTGKQSCSAGGDAAYRWVVSLNQKGSKVTGNISFHRCPGGGRASYAVSGTATSAKSVKLDGALKSSRGPLGSSAKSRLSFTITKNAPPSPNLAP